MVIGNGLIAKTFDKYNDNPEVVVFASGVSNSGEVGNDRFDRERSLLLDTIKKYNNKTIIYFSSCDVIYANEINKPYYYHKLAMEELVRQNSSKYCLFRLPQIIGYSTNKKSLINYFIISVMEKKEISIWANAYKNLIAIQDVFSIVDNIICHRSPVNRTINVINKDYYSVLDVINVIGDLLGVKARINLTDKGFKPDYASDSEEIVSINFGEGYLKKSIFKNYRDILNNEGLHNLF